MALVCLNYSNMNSGISRSLERVLEDGMASGGKR